ncbi:hypothetical protein [Blastococcus capsensis]|uniref:hypothetical protein n=1 Tax=Blastococcus capsensis TaxID=1564163 RepID=UPI00253F66F4|nr:hypothetical protein [Blastococcus capsensis]MDK3256884.1 hypothetical protein [Blastococcus capsensis]
MDPRTTTGRRRRAPRARRRPPATVRRPALYLGVAAAGAVMVNVLVGVDPAAQAEPGTPRSISVAQELGLSAQSAPVDVTEDLEPLQDLAASRSTREAEQAAAQQAQAAADQVVLDQQKAEAEAAAQAQAAAEAQAAAQAQAAAAAQAAAEAEARVAEERAAAQAQAAAPTPRQQATEAATAAASVAATAVARITNSAGSVRSQVQRAADAVVSNVPGAGSITLGGTRASAADPGGHPSGLALDYMVMSDAALGDAIVAYHRAHWAELGVDYLIWQQRMLSSPGGSWKAMENRGSATANHYDHVHVNYRG